MAYINKTTKTQRKIQEALLELMKAKKFEVITVSDITSLIDINRSTFYRHYLDKYDVLEKIENNILAEVQEFHKSFINNIPTITIDSSFEIRDYITIDNNFFIVFEKHLTTMRILNGKNGSITFLNKLKDTMMDLLERTFSLVSLNLTDIENELLLNFQASCLISIINFWTIHPELTVQEIFPFYSNIMANGLVNFVKEHI